ncbi:SRPBCC family protein [Wenxinia marina]|uniref:Polyketide cyclase / dehydrase and lipid transport n=1 Tax=Wenxinia marina DSM 24838 TaxID=1123501 RepID=A0A0D0QAW9_9RHOB|nr:SRPBCC family protein [Wenxinia marina]KIQ68088.1 Polyketide cyclase / dehydrase and lipid transport [Wenxinia marina DSM 24838]GGL78120.1 cyclase [Wenxinia marina]
MPHDHDFPRPPHPYVLLGLGALAGAVGVALYQQRTRNRVGYRPPDSAPGRVSRRGRQDEFAVVGRTVTINAPRSELYAFWRDFTNLPKFMENVKDVAVAGELTRWTVPSPMGEVRLETRVVNDKDGEQIAWHSTDASEIETRGKVMFRDAPAGRGTEVEALIAYVPPYGELGRWVAKAFQAEPALQGRRDLKRLKMLFETGEIATNHNRKTA